MRGATLYLNEMLEEREREQRRRARKAFGGAIAVAVLSLAAAMRERPPKIVFKEVLVKAPPEHIVVTETMFVEKQVIVPVAVPGRIKLLPFQWPAVDLTRLERPAPNRHLCVTPKHINFCGATVSDRVTVSNLGDAPVRITQVGIVSNRSVSGVVANADDCANRKLMAGDHCTIFITVDEAKGETMYLVIANDAGDPPDAIRVESPTAAASPARPAPAT